MQTAEAKKKKRSRALGARGETFHCQWPLRRTNDEHTSHNNN